MAEIILEGVSKRYPNGALALKETSFTIRDGEFFILVGPSGCGKSTLLNMIVGLEEVTEGEIRVDGKRINEVDPKDRNMAMVFQSYALYPHMTVQENLAFPLKLAKLPKDEIVGRVKSTAEMLQLADLLDRKPANLSGGQRQRVAMGRAIVRSPAVYLMDEPMSNLDARLRVEMRAEIARLQKRLGVTTVYVTHDQTEAMTLGDRVAVLREGAVQQIGTPRELYHEPSNLFVAGFIGSPAMNLLPAELHNHRLCLPMTEFELTENLRMRFPKDRSGLVAGIRPEHLQDPATAQADLRYGPKFQMQVDVLEWLGADQYVHFVIEDASRSQSWQWLQDQHPERLAGDDFRILARLDPASNARTGRLLDLWFDTHRLHLFDAKTGENLVRRQI